MNNRGFRVVPGRANSALGGVSSLAVGAFGIVWIISAASMGAPGYMIGAGVMFVLFAIGGAIVSFYNAGAERRFPIVEIEPSTPAPAADDAFCTACGAPASRNHNFCAACGNPISGPKQ